MFTTPALFRPPGQNIAVRARPCTRIFCWVSAVLDAQKRRGSTRRAGPILPTCPPPVLGAAAARTWTGPAQGRKHLLGRSGPDRIVLPDGKAARAAGAP